MSCDYAGVKLLGVGEGVNLQREELKSLPDWVVGFRPYQIVAVRKIMAAYDRGARMVVLDAPTGTGKTLIAEVVRRLLGARAHRSCYVATTKSLQDQFARDFPYAKVVKGRSNYPTELASDRFDSWERISCADCTKTDKTGADCRWCVGVESCPYEVAKQGARDGELAILNTSYWLTECNGPGGFSGRDFVVVDECDTLEDEVMGFVEVGISEGQLRKYGLTVPRFVSKEESWREWIVNAVPVLEGYKKRLGGGDIDVQREAKRVGFLIRKLKKIGLGMVEHGKGDGDQVFDKWIYTGDQKRVSFKPVEVRGLGPQVVWPHAERFLLMSASVISAGALLEELGWEKGWEEVGMGSEFPVANREVVVRGVANMVNKKKETEWPRMVAGVLQVLKDHPEERVLVHTVSYKLSEYLMAEVGKVTRRTLMGYQSARDRDGILSNFKRIPASVLFASSMERGVDLPDDLCRVQVICKVPFPNLGDKQVSARLYGSRNGQLWYTVGTVRSLIQMTGRGVRHKEDWCKTYVLDSQFGVLFGRNRQLFPDWWKEGLVWRG